MRIVQDLLGGDVMVQAGQIIASTIEGPGHELHSGADASPSPTAPGVGHVWTDDGVIPA
ncbi:hypothetical protein ACWGQ5_48585 [Streptomyces sp. NPDC055722]